jgi:Tfp pilus assembly protein PilF
MSHWTPARPRVGIIVFAGFALGLLGAAPIAWGQGALPDWKSLQQSVLELDVYSPGAAEPVKGVGFFLEGAEGLVTSLHLIKGASRVVAHAGATPVEITRYLARDPKTDIVLLDVTPSGPKLGRSSYQMVPLSQTVFAIVPASSATPVQGMVMRVFEGAGIGEILAVSQRAPQGAPVADSLGRVLAMIEPLGNMETPAVCAIPIERVIQLAARPDRGGPLAGLASDPAPPWLSPETAEGLQVLGGFYSRAERFENAVNLLTRATEKNPRLVEAWMEWGMALQLKDMNPDAEVKYRKAIELQPGNARAHHYFGSCLFNEEMLLQAQEQYDAALKADPEYAQAYVNLAGVYFRQDKKEDAERALLRAIELQPWLGIAHYNLGALYASQGRTAAALNKLDLLRKERSGFAAQLRHLMTSK